MRPGSARVRHGRGATILAIGVIAVVVIGAAIAPWISAHLTAVVVGVVGVTVIAAALGIVVLAWPTRRRAAVLFAELAARQAWQKTSRPTVDIRVTQTGDRDLHIHLHV